MSEQRHKTISELEQENRSLQETIRQRDEFIRFTIGRYLTDEVLEEILKNQNVVIGGERRNVTMMFADIRNSTRLSEEMDAADFIRLLNHFLEEMIEIINSWRGNILEFEGDAIVTVFGAPQPNEDAAMSAVACAVAMQRRMPAVNGWNREQGFPEISIGIGIHTGEAILGNIGSQVRTKYDMIGRNVNLAARIQSYAAGGQILISDETLSEAGERVIVNKNGTKVERPKGIQSDITMHDVIGFGTRQVPVIAV